MSLSATERGEGKDKMARAESNMSKPGMEEEYPGVGKFQKINDSQPASLRYGLDY